MFGPYQITVMLGFLVFYPIVYRILWNTLYSNLSYKKNWVFSQVSRFSLEPLVLIFESLIQSGRSSSLILEPPPSGVASFCSENP